ncbi:myosin-like protein [Plasmopara halstedii]|uniref:Myosin-like protein n=1 Tax=Plasmopara halstedii TaxID=4781 RepID=A0A0N7L5F6_PLAHL|nr:myosin-like protein [Plasmopara halstedii]CEG41339.1 myosin-like protein [Plasmopara halstedii]|eukprot:XP_024577708.1 myosin-like protein [Plasmopara halstedii]
MDEKEAAKAKLLIVTLQKYGYDLEDPARTSSSTSTTSSSDSSPTEWSPDDDVEPSAAGRLSGPSSASILALRDRKNQQSALHIAAKKGHLDVLRALAKLPRLSEHLNAGDRHSNTALHFAASSNRSNAPDIVELLLNLGANPSAVNVRGQTPLAIHIMTAKPDTPTLITKLFIEKFRELKSSSPSSPPSSPSSSMGHHTSLLCPTLNNLVNGTTYLHMAVERQLGEIGGALVQGGASINVPDQNGIMVSDTIPKKMLVKLITFMTEGSQVGPSDIVRGSCKICRNPKSLLDPLKDCALCSRAVCKNCSQKASEIRKSTSDGSYTSLKDKDEGRFCAVCCTVKILKCKKHNQRENFNKKLMGCGLK